MLNSFKSIWPFFKPYRFKLWASIFCVVVSVIMNVLEPFVLGIAITELTQNVLDMSRGPGSRGELFLYFLDLGLIFHPRRI